MRRDAIALEEERFRNVPLATVEDYPAFHERHRVFPAVFEDRRHKRILDIAAGVGVVGKRIQEHYDGELWCNDISPTCLRAMESFGLQTSSFDIDDDQQPFPFPDGHFDALVALATIEHVIHIEHFLKEISRILGDGGHLYLSAPNYSGLPYLVPFLVSGKTFHDPLSKPSDYEFYAHVRYFTYRTLVELTASFGFVPERVYLPVPEKSSRFLALRERSRLRAFAMRQTLKFIYTFFSPRWASEPVVCFRKGESQALSAPRKVVL